MDLRFAKESDVPLLADLNRQLIEDEQSPTSLSLSELELRMTAWLQGDYEAILFKEGGNPAGYALIRPAEPGWYVRQFFVLRNLRRTGVGRRAFKLLRDSPKLRDEPIFLEVLERNEIGRAFWISLGFEQNALLLRLAPPVGAA